jgi:hypothetical protein
VILPVFKPKQAKFNLWNSVFHWNIFNGGFRWILDVLDNLQNVCFDQKTWQIACSMYEQVICHVYWSKSNILKVSGWSRSEPSHSMPINFLSPELMIVPYKVYHMNILW